MFAESQNFGEIIDLYRNFMYKMEGNWVKDQAATSYSAYLRVVKAPAGYPCENLGPDSRQAVIEMGEHTPFKYLEKANYNYFVYTK